LPAQDQELLDERATRLERVWLGLRTSKGLSTLELPSRAREMVNLWSRQSWAVVGDGVVRLTPEGWLLLDRLSVELDSVLDADPSPREEPAGAPLVG
jgi:hypothetical protein